MDKYYKRQSEIKADFDKETANHVMTIIKDDGLHRHLRFGQAGSSVYQFDIVTYPNYLVCSGDVGCYVFSRTPDMFTFFRKDHTDEKYRINQDYWAEKLQACDVHAKGRDEWSCDLHDEWVKERFESWKNDLIEDGWDKHDDRFASLWRQIQGELLSPEDEHHAIEALNDFCFDHRDLNPYDEWWESYHSATHQYPYRLIWQMFAIVWAIEQYDAHHAAIEADKASKRAKRAAEQEERNRLYRVYFEHVEGAPFQVGDIVTSGETIGGKKQTGVVNFLDYSGGCGETFPDDPMISVTWHRIYKDEDATEHCWKEELALFEGEKDA